MKAATSEASEKAKKRALECIGLTVFSLQSFEKVFALTYLSHKTSIKMGEKYTFDFDMGDPDYRTTTTSHIRNLQQAGRIDTMLAERLMLFIDKRHELVHRWTILHGWPADDDTAKWTDIIAACSWLAIESRALATLFKQHADRMESETETEYSARQAEIFKVAGAIAGVRAPVAPQR